MYLVHHFRELLRRHRRARELFVDVVLRRGRAPRAAREVVPRRRTRRSPAPPPPRRPADDGALPQWLLP